MTIQEKINAIAVKGVEFRLMYWGNFVSTPVHWNYQLIGNNFELKRDKIKDFETAVDWAYADFMSHIKGATNDLAI